MSSSRQFNRLSSDLSEQAVRLLAPEIRKLYQAEFQRLKNQMMVDFRNHPVTIEIKGGIASSNISGTLEGGSGNLFSFIGFDKGSDPIQPIEELLQSTTFKVEGLFKKRIIFSVSMPSAKDIFEATPMPWANGRSWTKGIETGISGLGYYLLVDNGSSRSGIGIQSPRQVRKKGSRFKNVKYISNLINMYAEEFQNLNI